MTREELKNRIAKIIKPTTNGVQHALMYAEDIVSMLHHEQVLDLDDFSCGLSECNEFGACVGEC